MIRSRTFSDRYCYDGYSVGDDYFEVKCDTIAKTDGADCNIRTSAPACPTQHSFTGSSTVKVTDYCGCEGIKETTICKTHCKTSPFPTRVHVDRFVGKESNLGASESACKIG